MSTSGSSLPPDPARPLPAPARRASVTLRNAAELHDADAMMDPANRSLADALRITYRVIQTLMIALVVLYLLSGFQTIKETEQGIRVLFGRQRDVGLEPGFRFSYPAPLGELVKVNTGNQSLELYEEFWFYVSPDQKDAKITDLAATASLNPERDGSLLTADNNVAHAKVLVTYRHDPAQIAAYARNVLPDDAAQHTETNIVRGAVKRAMVQAVAETPIDELLRQGAGEAGSVAGHAKELAQAILDRSATGIRIEQLKLEEKMPPLNLREAFTRVQTAAATSASAIVKAGQERDTLLNSVAGEAAPVILKMIEQLELDIAKKDDAARQKTMDAIMAVFEGRATEFNGSPVPAGLVSGEVTTILGEAIQYRTAVVQQRKADATLFRAQLESFRSSPLVMVHREWADSMMAFMGRENVQVMLVPPDTHTLQLSINSDPSILKDLYRKAKIDEGDKAAAKRAQEQKDALLKLDTGLKVRSN